MSSLTKNKIINLVKDNPKLLVLPIFNPTISKKNTLIYNQTPYYKDPEFRYALYNMIKHNSILTLKRYFNSTFPYIRVVNNNKNTIIASDERINASIISSIIENFYKNNKYGLEGITKCTLHSIHDGIYYRITENQNLSLVNYVSDFKNTRLTTLYDGATNFQTMATSDSVIASVLIQVFSNLKYLKRIGFNNNHLTVENISVILKNNYINYDDIFHKSNFLVRITGFENSSLFYTYKKKNNYIHQENETNKNYIFEKSLNGDYILKPWTSFRVGSRLNVDTPRDWDTITFIISFLTIPEVYYNIITNTTLYNNLINYTFHLKNRDYIRKFIDSSVKRGHIANYNDVIKVLSGVFFIPGVLDRMIKYYG